MDGGLLVNGVGFMFLVYKAQGQEDRKSFYMMLSWIDTEALT